ncbi:hypothetical protein V5O48_015516 [Marasmius crinis-equi]|uniref:Uncharacterized protein n=1 Tax=Marasmius crinis-equi TaxID=585013 RepID=A0ABR3EUN3_9AGAR
MLQPTSKLLATQQSTESESDKAVELCSKRRRLCSHHTDDVYPSAPPSQKRKKPNTQKSNGSRPVPILPRPASPVLHDLSLADNEYHMSFIIHEDEEHDSFLVCFSGYAAADDEWVFRQTMDAPDLIEEYRALLDPEQLAQAQANITANDNVFMNWVRLLEVDPVRQAANDISTLCYTLPSGPALTVPLQSLTHSLATVLSSIQSAAREFDEEVKMLMEMHVQDIVRNLHTTQMMQLNTDKNAGLLHVIKSAFALMSCRALLFLYRWHIVYGPLTTTRLFKPDGPKSPFPSLQPLAQTIQAFIQKHKNLSPQKSS